MTWNRIARRIATGLATTLVATLASAGSAAAQLTIDGPAPVAPSLLPTWKSVYAWPDGDGYAGWEQQVTASDTGAYDSAAGLGATPGAWLWPTGGREYVARGAEWFLTAPGTTRFSHVTLSLAYANKLFAHHCLRVTLRAGAEVRDSEQWCKPPASPSTQSHTLVQLADPSPSPTAKDLAVEILMPACDKGPKPCSKWIPVHDPATTGAFVRVKDVDATLVDDDLPVVTASKAFYELDGTYIDGRQTYPLRVASEDAGSGVTRIDVDHAGWPGPQPPLLEHEVTCDPAHHTAPLRSRICPPGDVVEFAVDTPPMPEGTRRFRAHTPDVAGNVGDRRWTVIIDRTPPTRPQNVRFTTPEEGSAQPVWNAATDPVLPDATPGSGVARYQARARVASGAWTAWETLGVDAREGTEVFDELDGTAVEFEVRAIDAVGNVGEAVAVDGKTFGTAPAVSASGALTDVGYLGNDTVGARIAADDAGHLAAGSKRLWLERAGTGEVGGGATGCTPRSLGGTPWKASCPLTAAHDVAINGAALPEGASDFLVHAADRPGNHRSGAGFRVLVDHTAPRFAPDFGIGTNLDVSTGAATIDWDPASDPLLVDGNPGSGVDHYRFRYQRDNGGWSQWIATAELAIELPGSHSGERIDLEVQALDGVGNVSATVTGGESVGTTCRATADGFVPGCVDDDQEESDEEAPAQLQLAENQRSLSRSAVSALQYVVSVQGGEWVTIRSRPNSYVIGMAHDGWKMNVTGSVNVNNGDKPGGPANYKVGLVMGDYDHCGWVNAAGLDRTEENTESTCTTDFSFPDQRFTVGINCTKCDGPTPVKLKAGTPFCAVVSPTPLEGDPRECKRKIRSITGDQADRGYTVEWRYVTKGRKYVLVKDRHYSNPEGSWGFVHRSALPNRLCLRKPSQCDPDNNGDR